MQINSIGPVTPPHRITSTGLYDNGGCCNHSNVKSFYIEIEQRYK